ncbi:MAG: hypothetical protein UV61_C0017G0022 [Candidatus Gottesmanbacteria bacterium GW2011_GWB1_43_11]|uniref:Uncharacterized protein n=1 Tax=Candidatus Gottesmanbacteria bacterium GW2011_GWB1_43_11 TaxID=1618446 RepID=A0A0G1ER31_9BACT|nr:MAG: hypothetical protein UV04_C0017G0015 [Candidatus Gottesmanbacteria bacterium GW2011_GWA2_42_16]KKS54423.1 MAG: hypothetical protein UV17_C0019G0020 [Candidatus Gottesmanbacteria bacterium GW2011_GWA1_42_26]KKS85511.1 MAG: hypothetical protein UV61_C0017G0022 [Candidatus Gottesmanbacteria bacterium GW2011_GWB1_43_11]OGG10664.1 MAG: hypothetical protein A2699_02575 [Candidatus Gottesmanbacteria bacterium RIFCSPHIGHO2_01_FULL_43_15]OGG27390.1 MAG: hypothetical protein A3A59_06035 [Candidat
MMTTEERLRFIVTKVEQSPLPDPEKLKLYTAMREGIKACVMPVLLKNMSKEQLDRLNTHLDEVTPEKFVELVTSALRTPDVYTDMDELLGQVLDSYEKTLQEYHIID